MFKILQLFAAIILFCCCTLNPNVTFILYIIVMPSTSVCAETIRNAVVLLLFTAESLLQVDLIVAYVYVSVSFVIRCVHYTFDR